MSISGTEQEFLNCLIQVTQREKIRWTELKDYPRDPDRLSKYYYEDDLFKITVYHDGSLVVVNSMQLHHNDPVMSERLLRAVQNNARKVYGEGYLEGIRRFKKMLGETRAIAEPT